ncbi:MAG: AbrB family transcriptional regulator, partial [Nocardioidaceae bacterium]
MIRGWATTALIAAGASAVLAVVGLPSPVLFGSLVGGVAYAVLGSERLDLPSPFFAAGQAIVGVTIGSLVDVPT